MFTNTFRPMLGGIENSVATFAEDFRTLGHKCLVVTPEMTGAEESTPQVLRVPAIRNIGGSAFSLQLPVPGYVATRMDDYAPDIVHTHHPFLMGGSALRNAWRLGIPLVLTYHTLWNRYADSMGGEKVANLVVNLSVEYANACDCVIAPSRSLADMIAKLGVTARTEVVPTGIDLALFAHGDRERGRARLGIPQDAHVAGYVGRVGPEKNLAWLAEAAATWCAKDEKALFAIIGPSDAYAPVLRGVFDKAGLGGRLLLPGSFQGEELADAYAALDVFTFASRSDTQGLVLAEAMAAGLPIVALNAPGARESVADGVNGFLLGAEVTPVQYAASIGSLFEDEATHERMRDAARNHAKDYDRRATAGRMLALYEELVLAAKSREHSDAPESVRRAAGRLSAEKTLLMTKLTAAANALAGFGNR
jgi:glycosyltransferase involved in cell wall biosynthesis